MKSRGAIAPSIIEDIEEAFARAGHQTALLDFNAEGFYSSTTPEAQAKVADTLLKKWRAFKPDFALSYGFGGVIDLPGHGENLFEALKTPYLILLYDAPLDLASQFERLKDSSLLRVLCWDRNYVDWLKAQGVKRILRQPLGTNTHIFGAAKAGPGPSISFVGSLPKDAFKRGLPGNPSLQSFAKALLERKMKTPCKPFIQLVEETQGELPPEAGKAFASFKGGLNFQRFAGDLMPLADTLYKREAMKNLAPFAPTVYGGGAWLEAGLDGIQLEPPLPYGGKLADLYASSAININLSNSHLESAVNQRPFDCSAAGGFLLSDWREELPELFDPEREIPCFKTFEELKELTARYSRDESALRKMAEAARRRALSCHSWDLRVTEMAQWLLAAQ